MVTFYNKGDDESRAGSLNEVSLSLFSVIVKPHSAYKGEFGFDWMRLGVDSFDEKIDYRIICDDFESYCNLGYFEEIEIIENSIYYVPWLSMFHNQTVALQLYVNPEYNIFPYLDKEKDFIKITSPSNKIKCDPDQLTINELLNNTEIKLSCNSPLPSDDYIEIRLFSEIFADEPLVGKINLVKNDIESSIPIRFVKVLDKNGANYNDLTFKDFNEESYDELKSHIKNNGLNQALISPIFENESFNDIKTIRVDFNILAEEGLVNIAQEGWQPQFAGSSYNSKLRDFLNERHNAEFDEFKGIIIYMTVIHSQSFELGFAWVNPLEELSVFLASQGVNDPLTCLHEIGHALGLQHPFEQIGKNDPNIEIVERNILVYESNITLHETNIKNKTVYRSQFDNYGDNYNVQIRDRGNVKASEIRTECDDFIEDETRLRDEAALNLESARARLNSYQATNPLYVFEQARTDNIMDYNAKQGERIRSNPNNPVCFYKHQWDMMNEVISTVQE